MMGDTLIVKITKEQAAALKSICDQVLAANKINSANSTPNPNFASDENLLPRSVGQH